MVKWINCVLLCFIVKCSYCETKEDQDYLYYQVAQGQATPRYKVLDAPYLQEFNIFRITHSSYKTL